MNNIEYANFSNMMTEFEYVNISDMLGKTIVDISGGEVGNNLIIFRTSDHFEYVMKHEQNCCEGVFIEDVCGDFSDLVGHELVESEEISGEIPPDFDESIYDSYSWTFYKFRTIRGCVVIRWFGASNGYYGEGVSIFRREIVIH